MQGKIYFASDFHFGIPDRKSSLERENMLVAWLDMVSKDAAEIYLMGDLFDFWFEYKTVVPRGYIRLLGKLAEITDKGITVHLFRGNHDMWAFSYLQEELNIKLHRESEFATFNGKKFYLAHGDGLGPGTTATSSSRGYLQTGSTSGFSAGFTPTWASRWRCSGRAKAGTRTSIRTRQQEERNLRLIKGRITVHSEEILKSHPDVDFLIYGHYHYPLVTPIGPKAKQIVLGDWLTHFTYAVFDGEDMKLEVFQ